MASKRAKDSPPPTVELTVHDVGWDGRGVGRLEEGRVVFVEGALPGDRVLARTIRDRRGAPLEARLQQMLEPSPDRVPHPCPHAPEGCPASPLGSWEPEAQLAWKARHLEQTLARVGKIPSPPVADPVPSPHTWRYRERIELTLRGDRAGIRLGYVRPGGLVVPVRECRLAQRTVVKLLRRLVERAAIVEEAARRLPAPARLLLRTARIGLGEEAGLDLEGAVAVLFLPEFDSPDPSWARWLAAAKPAGWQLRQAAGMEARFFRSRTVASGGAGEILRPAPEGSIALGPLAFTQANPGVAHLLVQRVLAELDPAVRLLDLYAGWGPFGVAHAARGGAAVLVEASREALAAGRAFCRRRSLPVEAFAADLAAGLPEEIALDSFDAVLLDPPRRGADGSVLQALERTGPARLLYVSCHPAALARDLRRLPSYGLLRAVPFDMFPGTPELETLAVLQRRG